MRHLFFLFPMLFSLVTGQAQSSSYLQEMITRLENAKKSTVQVAQMMPENQYGYKPTTNEMSFREQLLHISQNINWLTASYLTPRPRPIPEADLKDTNQSKATVEQFITQSFDYAIESIRAFNADSLEQRVTFFAGP